jgi:2-phospho-L-lactate guanylyltransferase
VGGVTLLGGKPEIKNLAQELGHDYIEEYYDAGLSANLNIAARQLGAEGVTTLAIIPSDLPLLQSPDIDALLDEAGPGLCICAASRDGGTNALVLSPPDAIQFHFGVHSAQRHFDAGRAAGLASRKIDQPAFAIDIDTPDDLAWLCQQAVANHTADFLDRTGLRTKILQSVEALTA